MESSQEIGLLVVLLNNCLRSYKILLVIRTNLSLNNSCHNLSFIRQFNCKLSSAYCVGIIHIFVLVCFCDDKRQLVQISLFYSCRTYILSVLISQLLLLFHFIIKCGMKYFLLFLLNVGKTSYHEFWRSPESCHLLGNFAEGFKRLVFMSKTYIINIYFFKRKYSSVYRNCH